MNQAGLKWARCSGPDPGAAIDRRMTMARHAKAPTHAKPWMGSTLHAAPVHAARMFATFAKAAAHHSAGATIHAAIVVLAAVNASATVHSVTMVADSGAATIDLPARRAG